MAREVIIPIRKGNRTLPYAESLWIASGRNDMGFITHYVKRMMDFSDDGNFMRGGYGPRLRDYNGTTEDYKIESMNTRQAGSVDQLNYVVECFREDKETRRAVIAFGDPMKDNFDKNGELKTTKDYPCTRELHFIKQPSGNKLDLIVRMRSNDLVWGASAVNIFNYTFIQEYVAAVLGMDIGNYYHIVDNLHYYEHHQEMIHAIAELDSCDEKAYALKKSFKTLFDFDNLITRLASEEAKMRKNFDSYDKVIFTDQFFQHWYEVLYQYNYKRIKR